MRKAFLLPFFALAVLLLACTQTPVDQEAEPQEPDKVVEEISDDEAPEPLIGGDTDEHGCLVAAGYSWCEPKEKCMRMWEEECYESTEEAIQAAFVEKYDKDSSEIDIEVTVGTDKHARGMVKINEEGGLFLSAEANGVWAIVHDGNGAFSCRDLEQYDFPAEMIKDCADF